MAFMFLFSSTAFANSGVTYVEGVDARGIVLKDINCPIEVTCEKLTFNIPDFVDNFWNTEIEEYSMNAVAEYTFYNPADYTVTATLLFPLGSIPAYFNFEDTVEGNLDKYTVTVNGEEIDKKIKYSHIDGKFNFKKDSAKIMDEAVSVIDTDIMPWYEYEITLEPNETVVNTVSIPLFPGQNSEYEPEVYDFTYLLSPAKTWSKFGTLDVVINTSYYIIDSSEKFQKTENGYEAHFDRLPDNELKFKICESETPDRDWMYVLRPVLMILYIIFNVSIVVFVIHLMIKVIRRIKKRRTTE